MEACKSSELLSVKTQVFKDWSKKRELEVQVDLLLHWSQRDFSRRIQSPDTFRRAGSSQQEPTVC